MTEYEREFEAYTVSAIAADALAPSVTSDYGIPTQIGPRLKSSREIITQSWSVGRCNPGELTT